MNHKTIFIFFIFLMAFIFMAGAVFAQDPAAAPSPRVKAVEAKAEVEPVKEAVEETVALDPGNVTVNFRGADIKTVLAYISEVAEVDIVPAPDVKGIVDLRLTNKPWKSALDIIVRNYGLAYEREGDVIRVVTLDKLKQEEPMTQAFHLNYGDSKKVMESIKGMVTDEKKIKLDERTNTIVVTDIPTKIYKIGQIIDKLDKQTDQVLIEAMVVETTLGDDEKLGIDWNAAFMVAGARRPTTIPFEYFKTPFESKQQEAQVFFPQVLTAAPTTTTETVGGATVVTTAGDFPASTAGFFGFPFAPTSEFSFGTIDFSQFMAIMEAVKQRSDTEVVANPRITTLNNEKASIHAGLVVFLPKFERNSTTGRMEITGYTVEVETKDGKQETKGIKTGVVLDVTPHINEKSEIVVVLEPTVTDNLEFQPLDAKGDIIALVMNERKAATQARIKDGDTVFIGGLIKEDNTEIRSKLPIIGDILGDVPGIGLLVSHKTIKKVKREVIFFVTVNILDPNKKIARSPDINKGYIPEFTLSQEEKKDAKKKKRIRSKI